jgi:hypothetical protein
MIKANELRLGNWVHQDVEDAQVKALAKDDIVIEGYAAKGAAYDPIPLTEDWLLKFGFEKKMGSWELNFRHLIVDVHLERKTLSIDSTGTFEYFICWPIDMSFVHQLQNVYFALTGEELTIKQPA